MGQFFLKLIVLTKVNFLPPRTLYKFRPKRTVCPSCGARRGWSGLVNEADGYGYCHACGEKHFPNAKDESQRTFAAQHWAAKKRGNLGVVRNINYHPYHPKTIDFATVETTLSRYPENSFCRFLAPLLGDKTAVETLRRWNVGTGANGAAVFWHKDANGNFRYGKQISFDVGSGKKLFLTSYQTFNSENGYRPCLFGESELPAQRTAPVVFVESEKNAVLGDFWARANGLKTVWIATGGVNGLTESKATVIAPLLQNRKIFTVFDADDAGRKGAANVKAALSKHGLSCEPLDIFPERSDGWDIADQIVSELKNIPKNALKTPVEPPKPEKGKDVSVGQTNAIKPIFEGKNRGVDESNEICAKIEAIVTDVWPLTVCETLESTVVYTLEFLAVQHNLAPPPPNDFAAFQAVITNKFNAL
ncbi:MAG: hypothetical protein FMNOHCHN_03024 [Ignavibacteriaceae bacterium]|nr:hypothetical protein [Ignavibacteriaceae bacterium]